jgi:hypothetical protein
MRLKPRSLKWALPIAALVAASTSAQPQRVRVIMGSHLPSATEKSATYAASCGPIAYRLTVTPAKKSVILVRSNGPDVDLSTTTVGARLLEEDVLVQVGFNCPYNALNIFLKGVKLVDLGQPTGFRDHISVDANGEPGASSPAQAPVDELAIPRPETKVPQP